MSASIDPVALASQLIACPSVTPATGAVFDVLAAALEPLGFTVHRFVIGEAPDGPVENCVAIRGSGAPHFGFAGHLDVVPAGEGWSTDPFDPTIEDGRLIGRGANDMKSAVAAFISAAASIDQQRGTISLLITGDEEGPRPSAHRRSSTGCETRNRARHDPDRRANYETRLGDTVKIGRRGSVNMWIEVPGTQGHVAYPHRADNPVPPLARLVAALDAVHLDEGTEPSRRPIWNSLPSRRP